MNPDQPITELFSQPGCGPCIAVERDLKRHGIPYIKHNIREDENAASRIHQLGYRETPVTIAPDGTSFAGYQRGKIRALKDD